MEYSSKRLFLGMYTLIVKQEKLTKGASMNIDIFIKQRKKKGLSQIELAHDICTQATLSRFEKNGQVPSLKIVLALCERLDLPISNLFPKVEIQYSLEIEKLNKAEFYLITSEYQLAHDLLETIFIDKVNDLLLLQRYYYIKTYLMIFNDVLLTEILLFFDKILNNDINENNEIYHLLAYIGIGMTYQRDGNPLKAESYYNKVLDQIYKYPIKNNEDTWRILNIVYQSGEYYANIREIEVSNALLEYVVEICSHNHVTYYLARAFYQLALNAMNLEKNSSQILELLYDARTIAKINKNPILLNKIGVLENKYSKLKENENQKQI